MADIEVDTAQWNKASLDLRDQIADTLRKSGLLKPGDQLVPGAAVAGIDLGKIVCHAGCDAAQAAAVAACALIPPPGVVICIAAAAAAANACHAACG